MNRILLTTMMAALLAGCGYGEYESLVRSQPPQGRANYRPLDYPLCNYHPSPNILLRWRVAIYSVAPAWPDDYDRQKSRGLPNPGCNTPTKAWDDITWTNPGTIVASRGIDSIGVGYFYASGYGFKIVDENLSQDQKEIKRKVEEFQQENLRRTGFRSVARKGKVTKLTFNGAQWEHYTVEHGKVSKENLEKIIELTGIDEVYDHRLDDSHVLRIQGGLNFSYIQVDPDWLQARRDLARKMAEGTRVVNLTDAEFEKYKAMCEADEHCRPRK